MDGKKSRDLSQTMITFVAKLQQSWNRSRERNNQMTDSSNNAGLSAYLNTHANDAQVLLEILCRQPSVVAQNLGMSEMADLIETLLGEIGFQAQRLHTEGAPPAIYGELRGRSDYTI